MGPVGKPVCGGGGGGLCEGPYVQRVLLGGDCESDLWERALRKGACVGRLEEGWPWGPVGALWGTCVQGPSMFAFTEAAVCLEEEPFPRGSGLGNDLHGLNAMVMPSMFAQDQP